MVKMCHTKLTDEYRFWVTKPGSTTREAKLADLNRDIIFIKGIESGIKIDEIQFKKLKVIVNKPTDILNGI